MTGVFNEKTNLRYFGESLYTKTTPKRQAKTSGKDLDSSVNF